MLPYVLLSPWIFLVACGLWRLFFHPLRKFRGPYQAALTTRYQADFDIIKHGGLLRKISELHKLYGPVVRIAPNELSFSDPQAYFDIFAIGSKFTKDPVYYQTFGVPRGSPGIIDPALSRNRRELLGPFFSRRAIIKLENVIQDKGCQCGIFRFAFLSNICFGGGSPCRTPQRILSRSTC
ncbi:hypothetical protein HGRIS_014189 [Hohenbuehelia grisea]|uniref:Cytochrome P450 n=1 Tax=Hohenbuehelia grisea TaxID=104357 RepID=A0ABR3JUQ2_9AGAR